MSKIAILISGGLRTFWFSFDSILKNFIIPNNADIFIYTGYDNFNNNMKKIYTDNHIINLSTCSSLISRSNPYYENKILYIDEYSFIKNKFGNYVKDIKFYQNYPDDIEEFENDFNERLKIFKNYNKNQEIAKSHYGPLKYVFEQYFRLYKCNEMKKEYERKNNFQYDYCIRLRPDFYYDNIVDLSKLNIQKNTIYAPNDYGYNLKSFYVAEWFYFGDNNTMNLMTSEFYKILYTDIKPYKDFFYGFNGTNALDSTFVPEVQFAKGICLNNLNVVLVNIKKLNAYDGTKILVPSDNFINKFTDVEYIYIIYCTIDNNNFIC